MRAARRVRDRFRAFRVRSDGAGAAEPRAIVCGREGHVPAAGVDIVRRRGLGYLEAGRGGREQSGQPRCDWVDRDGSGSASSGRRSSFWYSKWFGGSGGRPLGRCSASKAIFAGRGSSMSRPWTSRTTPVITEFGVQVFLGVPVEQQGDVLGARAWFQRGVDSGHPEHAFDAA